MIDIYVKCVLLFMAFMTVVVILTTFSYYGIEFSEEIKDWILNHYHNKQ